MTTEVFLGREALGDGLPRHVLRTFYKPLFRGVYIPRRATPDLYDRTLGAWLTTDRVGVVAGLAASALHGAEWVADDESIELLVQERRRQKGLTIRMDRVDDDEITTVTGLLVTNPARTAFDIGRYRGRYDAIGRLDALMRSAPFRADDVAALIRRYGPVRGIRQLRELLPLVDPGAQSLQESWLRMALIDGSLAIPETQIPILDDDGVEFAFVDMGWREIKLAVEYDGDQHRTSRPQYVKDIRRIPKIEQRGWEVIRVINEDRQAEVVARVREAYFRRGGIEMDGMARSTRTSSPVRSFGRNERVA